MRNFPPGTQLFPVHLPDSSIGLLASRTCILLVNRTETERRIVVAGDSVILPPLGVVFHARR
jgi:hypothetical protein